MKFTKILSIVTSIAMSFCMISTPSVNAEESEEKIYTLSELFEMSDEEFLALDNAQSYYESIKGDTGNVSGTLWLCLTEEDVDVKYTANVTESEISRLLGDTVEYEINSPISLDFEDMLVYGNIFDVWFNEYTDNLRDEDMNDKEMFKFAKCYYCVEQVIDVAYYHSAQVLLPAQGDKQILTGDVNVDKKVDIYDAIWIASDLANVFDFTDGQRLIGDINEDGECNLYDAVEIAKSLM